MPRESQVMAAAVVSKSRSMAQSRVAKNTLLHAVERMLARHVGQGAQLCVALSGGVDSVVLLDVLTGIAPRYRWRLSAIHVNHQLNPHAAEWVRFCRRLCRDRGVPLRVVKVNVPRGDSIEAAARAVRYSAYRAQSAPNVVLAQHQDDQAETVLLQLLRGAGVKGLAAMPEMRVDVARSELKLLRPLLGVTRREIERCAAVRQLQWVQDDSNDDSYYLRNFLRKEIMPRLEKRVPAYRTTLSRAATRLAEADQMLDSLAMLDGADALNGDTLAVAALQDLPAMRARNLLRYFLAAQGVRMPEARRLDEVLRQLITAKADARVCIRVGDYTLRRYRGVLHIVPMVPAPAADFSQRWNEERSVAIPALCGVLKMQRRRGTGIDLQKLLARPVTLRVRRGSEKLQPDAARPRRTIKDLFQSLGIPPWQRDRVPFLWSGERLVWVAGVGIDCAFRAEAGAPGVVPQWIVHTQGATT